MKMKKESEAKKAFEEAINTDKNNSHAYLGLGQCYYNEGDDKNAIKYYAEAIKINPEFDNALCSKANALAHSEKKMKFLNSMNNAIIEKVIKMLFFLLIMYSAFMKKEKMLMEYGNLLIELILILLLIKINLIKVVKNLFKVN